jgi:hypothetical protein
VYPFETPFRGSTTTAAPVAPVEPLAVEQTTSTATLPPMTATPFVGPTPSLGASTTSLTPPQQVDESSTRWPAVLALGTLLVVGGPIAARRLHLFPTR